MKAGREHRVPLSQLATEILDAAQTLDGQGFVFPEVRGTVDRIGLTTYTAALWFTPQRTGEAAGARRLSGHGEYEASCVNTITTPVDHALNIFPPVDRHDLVQE